MKLKWKKTAEGALALKDRGYASWLEGYTGDILLIGISYDEKKGHACKIEKKIHYISKPFPRRKLHNRVHIINPCTVICHQNCTCKGDYYKI